VDRYQGAMIFGAVGDALGWPTEFIRERTSRRPPFSLPLRNFVRWQKFVGGRWWGYRDEIAPGEYSDDTQLTLSVTRSISPKGFEPETFAYSELPLWLHYERGGGRSVKLAARTLLQKKSNWLHNFYKQGPLDYLRAGANGAAMRNLPIALYSFGDERQLVRDSLLNTIITHGHPRSILGTVLFALAVCHVLSETHGKQSWLVESLRDRLERIWPCALEDNRIAEWTDSWEKSGRTTKGYFEALFSETVKEAHRYLEAIKTFQDKPTDAYYRFVGALDPETKGSGLATVCAAIYMFVCKSERLEEAIYMAANQIGSDTDTIASFLGALLGARYGVQAIPAHLAAQIQDKEYLVKVANRLHALASGEGSEHIAIRKPIDREGAFLRILAWEIGLHEMFWDAIDIGAEVVHPTLGRGMIKSKRVTKIAREGFQAKLIRISFDCGQSCIFHSRVQKDQSVSESLAKDVEKALH
jgi:ADP-ribosylglycohydrolase